MNTMMRVFTILLLALLSLIGCERQTNTPDNTGENPPTYEGPYYITMTLTYLASSPPYPNDEVLATVRIVNRDSVAVPDSMDVHWSCRGNGVWLDTTNTTYAGIATNRYLIGNGIGVDALYATFGSDTSSVTATQLVFVYDHTPMHISLEGEQFAIAIPNDTLSYRVTVFDERWNPVRDTYQVHWSSVGRGRWLDSVTNTQAGYTGNLYRLGIGPSIDTLVATIRIDTILVSQIMPLITITSNPEVLTLTPISHPLHFNESYALAATVRDSYGNAILHPPLQWETSGYCIVNLLGYSNAGDTAFATLQAGTLAGHGTVSVSIQNHIRVLRLTRPFTVIPNEPVAMHFESTYPTIFVRGSGMVDQTELQVQLLDAYSNPVLMTHQVQFELVSNVNFGALVNRPFFVANGCDTITLVTNPTGYVATRLSSGIRPGDGFIKATWLRNERKFNSSNAFDTTITVTILPGPPATIDLSWDRSTTQSEGGGQVSVSINARVTDRYSNPVQDGIAVNYTVEPDTLASINPATTGNLSPTGIRVPGTAFSRMQYQSYNAFDTATVTAHIQSIDTTGAPIMITGTWREHLPLVNGQLVTMQLEPRTWTFSENGARAVHLFSVGVLDGYGQRIARAPIVFSTQRGRIYATRGEASRLPNGGVPMSPPRLRTGNYPGRIDSTGYGCATVFIGASLSGVFLDTTMQTVNSVVTAYLEGYGSIDQISDTIVYRR